MKQIVADNMEEFEKLKENEWFEYLGNYHERGLVGIKLDENYVAFINCNMKFIIGKAYKNCITIGNRFIYEFDSFYDLIDALEHNIDAIIRGSNL